MKKTILLLCFLLSLPLTLMAVTQFDVKVYGGLYLNLQVCTDGIFRVRISPRPHYAENLLLRYGCQKADWGKVNCLKKEDGASFRVTTARCTVVVDKRDASIQFLDRNGKTIIDRVTFCPGGSKLSTSLGKVINKEYASLKVAKNNGIIGDDNNQKLNRDTVETGDYRKCSVVNFSLRPGERFYGGGSTSREHIQHRGELLRMWVTYQHTEIPQPFLVSSNGWGVFNNTTRKNFFDVGRFQSTTLSVYNTTDEADFYVMVADNMPGVINDYTLITGRTYLLPKYAYGLCFGPNMLENQFDILRDAVEMRRMNFPCDLLWLEPQWMERRYDFSTKKKWNYKLFTPEPYWDSTKVVKTESHRLLIGRLHGMGFKLGLWLCADYDLSLPEEDLIAKANRRPQSGMEHWMDHLTKFVDNGVNGFKIDPARTIDEHTDMKYYNGKTDKEMHNLNQVLLPKQMELMLREHTGKRYWHHYTAGYAGTAHWNASTSGDNGGGRTALFDQLNLGMSGFLNTSCDVMSVSKEQEMESLHFGIFLPWVQINSWYSLMQPFYFAKKDMQIYRDYVQLRYDLIPYIYSHALEATQDGLPIVRAMPLEFPDDHNVEDATKQYMFGRNLLVGAFTDSIYLPKGQWTDFFTGQCVSGGALIKHPFAPNRTGLLFAREGAIIPMQMPMNFVGERVNDTLAVKVFPGSDDSSFTLLEDDGESYEYEKGKIARTRFSMQKQGSGWCFIVAPTEGDYKGMPMERAYFLQVYLKSKPRQISVNGRQVDNYEYQDGCVKLTLPRTNVRSKTTVLIR